MQLLVQCEIFGAPRGHLVREDRAYVVHYDDKARAELAGWLDEALAFLATLETGASPDPDGHDATTAALIDMSPAYDEGTDALLPAELVEEFRRLHAQRDEVSRRFKAAQNQVRQRLGTAQFGVDVQGRRVVKRNVYKRRGYEVAPSTVDELRRLS